MENNNEAIPDVKGETAIHIRNIKQKEESLMDYLAQTTPHRDIEMEENSCERLDAAKANTKNLAGYMQELQAMHNEKVKEEMKETHKEITDLNVIITVEDGSPVTDVKGNPINLKTLLIACLSVGDTNLEDRVERFNLIKKLINKDLVSLTCGTLSVEESVDMSLILKWVDKTIHSPFLWGRVREELGTGPITH